MSELGELQRARGTFSPCLFQTRGLYLVNIQPDFDGDPICFMVFVFGGGRFAPLLLWERKRSPMPASPAFFVSRAL